MSSVLLFLTWTSNHQSWSLTNVICKTLYREISFLRLAQILQWCRRELNSLRKQPTFGDAITGFPDKWGVRNERRNSILMTRYYPDLGSSSNWLNQISLPYDASSVWNFCVSQTSFRGETGCGVSKCCLFSQAIVRSKIWIRGRGGMKGRSGD